MEWMRLVKTHPNLSGNHTFDMIYGVVMAGHLLIGHQADAVCRAERQRTPPQHSHG